MAVKSMLVASAALLTVAIVAAQAPGGAPGGSAPQQPQQQPMPQSTPNAETTGPAQMSAQKMADQSFVRNTIENSDDQVRLSQLAGEKSASPDIKQYSQQMVKVHGDLESQLQPVAGQMGVSGSKGPSKKEKKEIERLQALSGPDFDTAYLEDMGHAQRESLKQFNEEAKNNNGDPALKQAAGQDTPILTQHYQILEKIAQAHNVDLEGKEKK